MKHGLLFCILMTSPALADPQEDCKYKLLNVSNNLQVTPRSVADADRQLQTAKKFWADASACSPKFAVLKPLVDRTKADLDKAVAYRGVLAQVDTYAAQLAALAKRFATVDDKGFQALVAEAEALDKTTADFLAKNNLSSGMFREAIRDLKAAAQHRGNELAGAKVAADNKAIVDAAVAPRLGFTPEDAYDQKKIRDAFGKAAAGDFVVVVPDKKGIDFRPVTTDHVNLRRMAGDNVKYGGDVMRSDGKMQLLYATSPAAPAGLSPVLVWNATDADHVAIVTLDGGRYVAPVAHLAKGISKPESWPNAVQNLALSTDDIAVLVEAKLLPASITKTFAAQNEANEKCNKQFWAKVQPQFDAVSAANITAETRRNRIAQLQDKFDKQSTALCGQHETAFRKAWVEAIETRKKDREQTLGVGRARLTALATP